MPSWRRCSTTQMRSDSMTSLSSKLLVKFRYECYRQAHAVVRLAVNNEWPLEEGWGLYLVRFCLIRPFSITDQTHL